MTLSFQRLYAQCSSPTWGAWFATALTYAGDCRYPLGVPGSLLPPPTWGTADIPLGGLVCYCPHLRGGTTGILLGCLVLYWYTCLLLCTPSPLTSIKACGYLPSAHCLVHRGNSASSWPPDAPQFPPPASPLVLPPLGWVRSARSCCPTLHTYHRVIIQMYNYWSIA